MRKDRARERLDRLVRCGLCQGNDVAEYAARAVKIGLKTKRCFPRRSKS